MNILTDIKHLSSSSNITMARYLINGNEKVKINKPILECELIQFLSEETKEKEINLSSSVIDNLDDLFEVIKIIQKNKMRKHIKTLVDTLIIEEKIDIEEIKKMLLDRNVDDDVIKKTVKLFEEKNSSGDTNLVKNKKTAVIINKLSRHLAYLGNDKMMDYLNYCIYRKVVTTYFEHANFPLQYEQRYFNRAKYMKLYKLYEEDVAKEYGLTYNECGVLQKNHLSFEQRMVVEGRLMDWEIVVADSFPIELKNPPKVLSTRVIDEILNLRLVYFDIAWKRFVRDRIEKANPKHINDKYRQYL